NYPLTVTGLRPYQDAQVTAGGIDLADFDPETLMSWLVPGLFACGEVLDVTGDCGGYNLQWAWASGRLAGRSAAAFAG
ncbi:MAG: NAD(P)/FAD-dependent oxidoreductase, partial [Peptococcus niger]